MLSLILLVVALAMFGLAIFAPEPMRTRLIASGLLSWVGSLLAHWQR